jgi:pimeloyl-ACP methyl ester carboxylesterase
MSNPSSTTTRLAGSDVVVYEPTGTPNGVTFLVPGSWLGFSRFGIGPVITDYTQIKDALIAKSQVVIGFFRTDVTPFFAPSHDDYANLLPKIFQAYRVEHPNLPEKYNVVGHSVGGKIALLAAVYDPDGIKTVISLDPVDDKPQQFTKARGVNLTLEKTNASVHIIWAMATAQGLPFDRNARVIHEMNATYPNVVPLVSQENADHFAYVDTGRGPLISGGTDAGNTAAREAVLDIIRRLI